MKKTLLVMLLIIVCIVSACSKDKEYGLQSIKSSEVINKISNKDTFLLMVEHENSYACETFIEEIQPTIEEHKLLVYVLDETNMDTSVKDQLNIALGDYKSWPTLLYVKDGSITITDKYEYSLDPEGWMTWMKNMKLITKEN